MVLGLLRFKRERQVSLGEKGMWVDVGLWTWIEAR